MYLRSVLKSRRILKFFIAATVVFVLACAAAAHPLGNFTINHFARIQTASDRIDIRYVVDMAEISAFQELQIIDADGDKSPSQAELNAYVERIAAELARNISLEVDGARISLNVIDRAISLLPGAGGLSTLRIECKFSGDLSSSAGYQPRRLKFEDANHQGRIGWHEIVVEAASGVAVFNSAAYGSGITDELKAYPENMLMSPLNERSAEFSFVTGNAPQGAKMLVTREGKPAAQARDRFAELITVPQLTPAVMFIGLLIAMALGGLHALSPGHGKTVVGAYLIGSRGTAKHAAFLGLTVTITHTAGVFALGIITLFATQYIVPEKIFPVLSFVSGAIVAGIGMSLFFKRLSSAVGISMPAHSHGGVMHSHDGGDHDHDHNEDPSVPHSHGGTVHSHLPPGTDGEKVTWRSLLALGISGGLLPCPSALVVLLSAISLNRVGYGLLLVLAFSFGLAGVLMGIGLLFVYARRFVDSPALSSSRAVRIMPVISSLVITIVGLGICYESLVQAGFTVSKFIAATLGQADTTLVAAASMLGLGFVLGLQHAMDADHLAAISAIVTEHKSVVKSSIVGAVWGVGHTISLLIAGIAVIIFHIEIGERLALWLEFCVALMLIGLGANALFKLARGGKIHLHEHSHGGHSHLHPHIHNGAAVDDPKSHHGLKLSKRPLLVGMMHGLAGSAALMLLVVGTTKSTLLSLAYIVVFGVGSVGGMLLMSALISMPIHLTASHFSKVNFAVRGLAGLFSFGFGLYMVYEIGFVEKLFG